MRVRERGRERETEKAEDEKRGKCQLQSFYFNQNTEVTGCKKLHVVTIGAKENLASILTLAKSVSLVTRSDGVHRLRAKAKERKTRGGRKEKVHWQAACKMSRKQVSTKLSSF